MDTSQVINKFVEVIRSGGIVLSPSDTCYGLFCDATDQKAVDKIFQIKQRDKGKPVSMIVDGREMAERYIKWDDQVEKIWNKCINGPYTMVLPKKPDIKLPIAMGYRVGIRIPDYPLLLELVKKLDIPIVATSANSSGNPVHYSVEEVKKELNMSKIDYIYDIGEIPSNPPSTLVIWNREKTEIVQRV